ncbi:major facilitator superfamily transporter [Colletotrichum graminicola M1.001]|uniref:Major facilitator superfamily transporter n=1 Tax=Colletotrichum graminicola (strain M1.001 / M2 / FGSC 10212) TaxID=645133 RepID=E3QU59_COLGM|nr:major facilitator superfamily transporter [Colletotrichum graminicola M1.001]EFQ34397.1 major facilitator superfamily transporter [Colletotrichum graminicola M1.001]
MSKGDYPSSLADSQGPVAKMDQDTTDYSSDRPSTAQQLDPEKGAGAALSTDATQPPPPGSDAPDGGLVAWLVVLGAWATSFCSFGWVNSVGAFQEYYQNDLLPNYSPSTISWIPSLQIFFMMGLGPLVGHIYDHYGPRWLLFGGTILHVFGLMMTSLATKYWQILLAQGICSAIGVAAILSPGLSVIHGWFNRNRGAAFGVLSTGSSLGGVIFPIMVTRVIKTLGFPWAMRICAFIILALLIIANLTIKAFHPPRPQKLSRGQLLAPLKEFEFACVIIGFFLFTYGIFVPINYIQVQALDAGMDPNLAQYLVSMLNAGSLFGRITSGILGDKIGRYNIFVLVGFLTPIWMLALWIPAKTDGAIIAFAVLFGFCSGAYVSLIAPLIAQISPIQEIGFRTGIAFLANAIAGLTTNPINGAILSGSGGWVGIKIFSGVFCLAGTAFILAARVRRTGWKLMAAF